LRYILPESTKFNLEIIRGIQYGVCKDIENVNEGVILSGLNHEEGVLKFVFNSNGIAPEGEDSILIRVWTTDNKIEPIEIPLVIIQPRIKVIFSPTNIMPGDTADVILKKIEPDGSIIDFEEDQRFDIKLIAGSQYGDIYIQQWEELTDESWYVEQGFKFIASTEIDSMPVESVLKVNTSGGMAGSRLPGNESTEEDYRKIGKSTSSKNFEAQKRNISGQHKTTAGDVSKSVMIDGTDEQLWGIGTIKIGSGNDCSDAPQCDELINPVINFAKIDTSICNENKDADGITKFYTQKFESEFDLSTCYNQTLDRWQFQIMTPLKYSTEICYKPDRIYLADTNQIKTIPYNDLCKAQEDFAGFENTMQTKYKILDIIKRHEYLHYEQNINILNDALAETHFYGRISSLNISCDEISNQQKAADFALNKFKNGIVATTMAVYRQKKKETEGDPYSDNIKDVIAWLENEEKINDDLDIKNSRDLYLEIARRINNCIN